MLVLLITALFIPVSTQAGTVLQNAASNNATESNIDRAVPALNETKLTLMPGKKYTLVLENADGCSVSWKSGNTDIVTVSKKGRITAVADGKTTVVATVTVPVTENKTKS